MNFSCTSRQKRFNHLNKYRKYDLLTTFVLYFPHLNCWVNKISTHLIRTESQCKKRKERNKSWKLIDGAGIYNFYRIIN